MRVISGTLKGRNIEGFNLDGTRPTMDRVKESLFASIQNYIEGATVLDLFAGSGNLGIEAISNGSDFVYFCDKNSEAVKVINKNLDNFKIKDKALVYNLDYMECLKILSNNKKSFDIIFLDIPHLILGLLDNLFNPFVKYSSFSSISALFSKTINVKILNTFFLFIIPKISVTSHLL